MLGLRFVHAAERQLERADTWWRENRPAAPELFARHSVAERDLAWPRLADDATLCAGHMQRAIIVRGRLSGPRRIELEEPVDDLAGEVEVFVRAVGPKPSGSPPRDILDVIGSLPRGTRTKEDIDRQVAEERESWGDR